MGIPEERQTARKFLQLCLRQGWETTSPAALRDLARQVGWETLIEIGRAERLLPLVYHRVRKKAIVPPAIESDLHRAYLESAARATIQLHRLEEVVDALGRAAVAVILLKGAALGQTVYPSPALRPMGDLDLLVRQDDAAAGLRALEELGYKPARVETRRGELLAYENELLLERPGQKGPCVELHWSLLDSPYYQRRLPAEWFWETALPLSVGGTRALTLGPEGQVLHLSAHLQLHHLGEGLIWFHDVSEVIAFHQARLDWDQLLAVAHESDLVIPLQQVLPRVAQEWAAPIPSAVLMRLQGLRPSRHEARIHARLTGPDQGVGARFWTDLASTAGWRARLRFAWINLFPSSAYMRHRYGIGHPLLVPLYYPYRWFLGLRSLLRFGSRKTT